MSLKDQYDIIELLHDPQIRIIIDRAREWKRRESLKSSEETFT